MLFDRESILVSVLDLSTFRLLHSHAYYCKEKLKTVIPDTYCTQKLYSYAHKQHYITHTAAYILNMIISVLVYSKSFFYF